MLKAIQHTLFLIFLMGVLLSPDAVAEDKEGKEKEKEKTPISMLRAIEQRNTELDQKAKQQALKEYRLRILEQEVSENLKKTKKIRDEMAKMRAEQKAAEAKREADAKAAEAKKIADAKAAEKAAEAKRLAEERAVAVRQEITKKTDMAINKAAEEERAIRDKRMAEEEEILRAKEEERRAVQAQQFGKLAKIYEVMSPEDAAIRLQNMKDEFALAIIPLIKPKKSSKILAAMDPIVAAKFTEKMGMQELSVLGDASKKKKR